MYEFDNEPIDWPMKPRMTSVAPIVKRVPAKLVLFQPTLPSIFSVLGALTDIRAPLDLLGPLKVDRPMPFTRDHQEAYDIQD